MGSLDDVNKWEKEQEPKVLGHFNLPFGSGGGPMEKSNEFLDREHVIMGRNQYYRLVGREFEACTLREWGEMFNDADERTVGRTHLGEGDLVCTYFLGMDHNFSFEPGAPPVLFETTYFVGSHRGFVDQWRHYTYDEAELFHERLVHTIRSGNFEYG